MRRAAAALVLVGAVAVPALARKDKRKRGRVVRVERASGARGTLRMCSSPQATAQTAGFNASATCYGQPPRPGEIGTVVDYTGVLGTVEIAKVTEGFDSCQNVNYWSVEGTVRSGNLAGVTWQAALLFDYEPAAAAKAIQNTVSVAVPSQRGETVMTAIDQDSDNTAELIITYYYCDLSANVAQQGGGSQAYCMVYWQRDNARYNELRIDVVKSCY